MTKFIDRGKLRWLLGELDELCEKGVLDGASAARVAEYYAPVGGAVEPVADHRPAVAPEDEERAVSAGQNYFMLVAVLLGALLIGGGVVLLFAHNWDMLSQWQRITTAFIPFVLSALCGVYTIAGEKDARWREFSAFSTAVSFAVLTALVSQIYHIDGEIHDFAKLVIGVSLPLVYIFRSQLLTATCFCGLFVFLRGWRGEAMIGPFSAAVFYMAMLAPWLLYSLFWRGAGKTSIAARYISLLPLGFLAIRYGLTGVGLRPFLTNYSLAAMLYAAGLSLAADEGRRLANPWLTLGWLSFTICLLAASHAWKLQDITLAWLTGFWLLPMAVGLFAALRHVTPLKLIVMLLPSVPLISACLQLQPAATAWVGSAYTMIVAAAALAEGLKNRTVLIMNAGMLQIALLVLFKFFDSDVGMLMRSAIFITLGAAFIAVNAWMCRRLRNEGKLKGAVDGEK